MAEIDANAILTALLSFYGTILVFTLWVLKDKWGIDKKSFKFNLKKRRELLLMDFTKEAYELAQNQKMKELEEKLEDFEEKYHECYYLEDRFDYAIKNLVKSLLGYTIATGFAIVVILFFGNPLTNELSMIILAIPFFGLLWTGEYIILMIWALNKVENEYTKIELDHMYENDISLKNRIEKIEQELSVIKTKPDSSINSSSDKPLPEIKH